MKVSTSSEVYRLPSIGRRLIALNVKSGYGVAVRSNTPLLFSFLGLLLSHEELDLLLRELVLLPSCATVSISSETSALTRTI